VPGCNLRALADSPRDWVQDPEQSSQASTVQESLLDIASECLGVDARLPCELVDDVEQSDTTYIVLEDVCEMFEKGKKCIPKVK
jgi:hypothetical protein